MLTCATGPAAGEYIGGDEQDDTRSVREPEGGATAGGSSPAATGRTDGAGTSAAASVRGAGSPVSGRPRITALGIGADIERTGSAALVGRVAHRLAQLAARP